MKKEEIKIGGIVFSLSTAKKMKIEDLKKWEKFFDVPFFVAESQFKVFLENNKK